jgi:hypothetical protein
MLQKLMSSKLIQLVMAVGILLSFTACDKTKEKVVEKTVKVNAWGKDFVIKPIAEGSADEKKWSRAVAIVEYINGGTGTGYFISDDGLFITNEHVVSREICTAQQCGGIRIIRGFSESGENQIYYKIRPLVQSTEYDFSLLKVELPEGEKVPFLELAYEEVKNPLENLVVIGHPAGSPTKTTPVDFEDSNDQQILYKGPTFWGNSGSPLIDGRAGKVVGLVSYLQFNTSIIESSGDFTIKSGALPMSKLVEVVRKVYPSFNNHKILHYSDLTALENNAVTGTKDLYPRKSDGTEKLSDSLKSVMNLSAEIVGTDEEATYIQKLFENQLGYLSTKSRFSDLLEDLNWLALGLGRNLTFNKPTQELIEKTVFPDYLSKADGTFFYYQTIVGQMSKQECLNTEKAKKSTTFVMYACHSSVTPQGERVLEILSDNLAELRSQAKKGAKDAIEDYDLFARYYVQLVGLRMRLGVIDANEVVKVRTELEIIAAENNKLGVQFRAQSILVKLAHQTFEKPF